MSTANPQRHAIARCRWCGGQFVKFFNQWLCENEACAEKQRAHAMLKTTVSESESPYLLLPLPLQVDLETSNVKRLLLAGAAGASKSYGARWHLYSRCRKYPGYRALMLRCTYDELFKNHLQFMHAESKQLGDAEYKGGNVRQMIFPGVDSAIFMGYCDDDADISHHTGVDWDEIVFEEGVNFLPKALNEITVRDRGSLPRRAIEGNCDGRTMIVTNPGGRAMLYLVDHYINRDPDRAEYPEYNAEIHGFIPATLEDNPYLNENFASQTLSGLSAARYKQLRFGDWTVFAGQFFSSFDPSVHVTSAEVRA